MNIEEQVLTIEQARHLQELGLNMSDSALCWVMRNYWQGYYLDFNQDGFYQDTIPTYTLQEVLDKLPIAFRPKPDDRNMLLYDSIADCQIWYENYYGNKMIYKDSDTLLDAAYKLLCWVVENGYLTK